MNTNELLLGTPFQKNQALEKRLNRLRKTLPYQIEYAKDTFSDEIWQAMQHRNMSQVKFAKKADVPKQFLTKVFRGGNCTIETMVRLAFALNYRVNIHLTPVEVGCAWLHATMPETTPRPAEKFLNLWTESGYQPITLLKPENNRDTVPAQS